MIIVKWVKKIIYNPFYVYALTIFLSLFFYSLGWSNYPRLSFPVYSLFTGTVIISLFLGYNTNFKIGVTNTNGISNSNRYIYYSIFALIFLTIGFIAIFINGGIPLYNILFSKSSYNYQDFEGISYVSTISMYGLSSLICLWINAIFVYRDKRFLYLIGIGFFYIVLMASRGYAMLALFPGILVVVYHIKLTVKKLLVLVFGVFLLLYGFGLFGDARERAKPESVNNAFYQEFQSVNYPKILPKQFLWGYLYYTSPLAKMEYTVQDKAINDLENDFFALTIFELMPYSFGLRVNKLFEKEQRVSKHVLPPWFVGTAFYGPYLYAGWSGVLIYSIFLFGLIYLIYVYATKKLGIWAIPVIANLSLYMALSVFDNMIAFAPLNFQLFWCLTFGYVMIKLKM